MGPQKIKGLPAVFYRGFENLELQVDLGGNWAKQLGLIYQSGQSDSFSQVGIEGVGNVLVSIYLLIGLKISTITLC